MGKSHCGDKHDGCRRIAYHTMEVTAEVVLEPVVKCGKPTIRCLAGELVPADDDRHRDHQPEHRPDHGCNHDHAGLCRLLLRQELCIAVPVDFSVKTACKLDKVVCETATTEPRLCWPAEGAAGPAECDDWSDEDEALDDEEGADDDEEE